MGQQKVLRTTLPDGREATFAELTVKDIEWLNEFIRKEYWKGIALATDGMNEEAANRLRLAAMRDVAQLSVVYGDGRDILQQSPCGLGREIYVMMQTPQMSFEEFCGIMYDGINLTTEGLALFTKVIGEFSGGPVTTEAILELGKVLKELGAADEKDVATNEDEDVDEKDVTTATSTETVTG